MEVECGGYTGIKDVYILFEVDNCFSVLVDWKWGFSVVRFFDFLRKVRYFFLKEFEYTVFLNFSCW